MAVVCTMAGVASGLALATTLMAMQVADGISMRGGCRYHRPAPGYAMRPDRGFLGVGHAFVHDGDEVFAVVRDSPAERAGLRAGDKILTINGEHLDYGHELDQMIGNAGPGSRPTLVVERDGTYLTLRPTLALAPHR